MIDSAATEFCMQFNTKNNRKKLVKCLYSVHRNRQDLLPFYARMVATLNPCMPDIAVQLGQYLKQEFRWQLRKKDQMKIESKLKVCRFVGELVKFQMFPKSEALFCLKQLLVSTYTFAILLHLILSFMNDHSYFAASAISRDISKNSKFELDF